MNPTHICLALASVILGILSTVTEAKLKEGDCEVCLSVVQRFSDSLDSDIKSNADKIEKQFKKFCKTVKGRDERFCYYLGGVDTSATYIVKELAKPISWGAPKELVCEKLKSKDPSICDLKYEKSIDLTKVNLKKLKVKELKKILSDWGEDNACKGCAEKSDFIKVIEDLMPKYAPEAAKSRKNVEL
ncbi:mesencephalic astrocyte-derived neurotrophic factor homolog [Liolophura sinensis]|uniref:mesencephalic astrocyte-derived neurotrophic factor homolog n=1 Tax=Liolophura sinensis TaxID=3198878 RepID=UPI0031580162